MSIADAVRARELEARVVALEERLSMIEQGGGSNNIAWRLSLLQGQINKLRRAAGETMIDDDIREKADNAA